MRLDEIQHVPIVYGNYKKRARIRKWLEQYSYYAKGIIHNDLRVDTNDSVTLRGIEKTHLPIQFGTVNGDFCLENCKLTSLKGVPYFVQGSFRCVNTDITSIEFAPMYIEHNLSISGSPILSFQNIHKHIKRIGGMVVARSIMSNALGLLMIEGLEAVTLANEQASRIITAHLNKTRDVHLCQEELLDAGFTTYAKL